MPAKSRHNPFYVLLIPAGMAFVVTAFAYGLMSFQAANGVGLETQEHAAHPLYQWLRVHGDAAIVVELVLLAILTIGAMAFDSWSAAEASSAKQFEMPPTDKRT